MPLEDKFSYSYSQTVSCAMGFENRKNSKIAKETPIKKPNKRTTIMCAGRSKKRFFILKSRDLRGESGSVECSVDNIDLSSDDVSSDSALGSFNK